MRFFGAILLNNINNLSSGYIDLRYGCIGLRDKFRQETPIIVNFTLFCKVIVKCLGFLLKIGHITVILKNGRDVVCFFLFEILLNAVQKCFCPELGSDNLLHRFT